MKNVIELTDRDECSAMMDRLIAEGRRWSSYYYWYEGVGTRESKVVKGKHVTELWNSLTHEEQLRLAFFGHLRDEDRTDRMRDLHSQYMEATRKDYEEKGSYYEVSGDLKDAIFVIEYD